jgi:hypothetical protein
MTIVAPVGVVNTYGWIERLKSMIGVTSESHDDALWRNLHMASRAFDASCHRKFFVEWGVKAFDVSRPGGFAVPDLASVDSIFEDEDGDRVYEVEREWNDDLLLPANANPLSMFGRPYTRIIADPVGPRPKFTLGHSRVQVTGAWGFRDYRFDSGASLSNGGPLSAGSTSFTVTDGSMVQAGMTVIVEEEQMFVRTVSGDVVTVVRGVNGTSAVTHTDGQILYEQGFPGEVIESTLLLAARAWKRKDSPYGPVAGVGGLGAIRVATGRDPDLEDLLAPFRRLTAAPSMVMVY